jgi:transcription antitermination factor NusG
VRGRFVTLKGEVTRRRSNGPLGFRIQLKSDGSMTEWFALWTRARAEAQVEARLLEREIEAFAALARVERQWSDRKKRIRTPLFPGYVFARIARGELVRALEVLGVAGVVRMDGEPVAIPDTEMESVFQLVNGVDETGTLPENVDPLASGTEIQVIEGPFKGLRGVILEGGPEAARVMVKIPAIQQARAIRLPRGAVAPVGDGARAAMNA